MVQRVRVRDVVRGSTHELGANEPALRGSYDLFYPTGPAPVREDGLVEWYAGRTMRVSRVAPTPLGRVTVGERVLLRLDPIPEQWWLCDVEAVDGVSGDE
jgi:hypothetical protein